MRAGATSQLCLKHDDKLKFWFLEYAKDVRKTNQGGLDHRHVQHKVVRAYQNEVNPDGGIIHFYKSTWLFDPSLRIVQ